MGLNPKPSSSSPSPSPSFSSMMYLSNQLTLYSKQVKGKEANKS
jgi:hypothetical protein